MNTLEKAIEAMNSHYSLEHEALFEAALRDAVIFYQNDFLIDLDDQVFLPIFTSIDNAQLFGMDPTLLSPLPLQQLKLTNGTQCVLNPATDAITLDDFRLTMIFNADAQTSIENADTTALQFLFALKPTLVASPVTSATLAKLVTGRAFQMALVVTGLENNEASIRTLVDTLAPHLPQHVHTDIFTEHDATGKAILKRVKPFYKR